MRKPMSLVSLIFIKFFFTKVEMVDLARAKWQNQIHSDRSSKAHKRMTRIHCSLLLTTISLIESRSPEPKGRSEEAKRWSENLNHQWLPLPPFLLPSRPNLAKQEDPFPLLYLLPILSLFSVPQSQFAQVLTRWASQSPGFLSHVCIHFYLYYLNKKIWTESIIFFLSCRSSGAVSAVVSQENVTGSSSSGTDVFKLTYLEVGFRFSWSGSFWKLVNFYGFLLI